MSFGMAQAMPPANTIVSNGVVVYQSTHTGAITNESNAPFQVILTATMRDSASNQATPTIISDNAQPNVPLILVANCELPVSNYTSGTDVTFIVTTTLQGGGVSESDTQQNTVTVP